MDGKVEDERPMTDLDAGGNGALTMDAVQGSGRLRQLGMPVGGQAVRLLRDNGILLALIVLVVAGALLSPHFLQPGNLANVARQAAIVGILGVGMTFVILTAGIDLSVGSILGFAGVVFAATVASGVPWPLAIVVALGAGALAGAINGLGITQGRLQPFIMTLGMLVIARGVTMTITSARPVRMGEAAPDVAWIGTGSVYGVPVPVLLLIAIAAVSWFVLRYTPFGRQVYAVGDNPEAARLSGINTGRVLFSVYVISGVCAAVSALIVVSRLTAGEPSQGTGAELDAIAIVVIGGTSLFGGEGGIAGTLLGAAIIAAMNNLLNLLGVSPFSQDIVKGLIILGAVFLERRSIARREGR
jgi:ribose/xylose/arabinose/galactoside ABC-type transport system permease subunit